MKKRLLFLVPSLFLLPSCLSNVSYTYKAKVMYRDEIVDNVKIGDKIEVEPRTLTYQGESKTVDGQIILPDGTSQAGKSFTITMPGKYFVKYRAFFSLHEESYTLCYHCHRTSGDFFLSSEKNNPAGAGEYSHPLNTESIQGAVLTLDSKTTYTYDGVIDFNSFSFENSFIDFVVDTSKQATSDIETLTIRLMDIEDSNNYIDITVTDSGPVDDDGKGCYILAGSNSQFKTGYEGSRLHIGKYGTNVGSSFRDLPAKSERPIRLYFNYAEKALYVSPIIYSGVKAIITDLDDKGIYGSTTWDGFNSGKATLSIFANSLISTSARIIVSKIGSMDLSPLDFVDTDAPIIRVDYAGQSSINVPMASVNKPYRIFDASVSDNFDRNLIYSTYVTYVDTAHNKTRDVSIINNTFTPKETGKYIITYTARDHSALTAEKTVEVFATDDSQEMTVSLDVDTITKDLYSKIILPSISEVNINGGSGKPTVVRTLYDSDNNPIEIEGNTFIPKKIGTYKAYYRVTDYINNVSTCSLTINVTDPGHPIFVGDLHLPRLLIKGHRYTLPNYEAVEVVNNETKYLSSKVYVNDVLLEDNSFVAGDNCYIKYVAEGTRGSEQYLVEIKVIDVGKPIDLAKYFDGNFSTSVNRNDVTLTAVNSGTSHALFASILPYDNPFVKFSLDRSLIRYNELVFKFSESTNANNSLTFHITFVGNKTYVSIGQDTAKYEFGSFSEGGDEVFAIDFMSATGALKDVLHKDIVTIKKNDLDEPFNGFNDGVYLDIEMVGVTSQSSIKILNIANQTMGNLGLASYEDFIAPVIIFNYKFINEQEYNADAIIPSVQIYDVLSDCSVSVSVRAPDKTYKIRDADASKFHSFILDQFGSYVVTYRGEDSADNIASYPRKITVYDFIPPELTITGSLKSTYSINAAIKIPSYTVTDNLNDYQLDIFLIMPDNQERILLTDRNGEVTSYLDSNNSIYNSSFKVNSTTFRAEQYGNYILRYVAYDSDFNKVVQELYFKVA